jgi:hypothetical protein
VPDPLTLLESIPSLPEIRQALARSATETRLLEQLLRLALRREREAERLARIFPGEQEVSPCS